MTLNKQVNELQDTLKMTKSSLENDVTQLKTRYGKDLARLQADYDKNSNSLRRQIEIETRRELEEYKQQAEYKLLHSEHIAKENEKNLIKQIQDEQATKEDYYLELQKLKRESIYLYQGGFGTFNIAFENPIYPKLLEKQKEIEAHRQTVEMFKQSVKGGLRKKRNKLILQKFEEQENDLVAEQHKLEGLLETVEIQPLEKLCHFVEVGF